MRTLCVVSILLCAVVVYGKKSCDKCDLDPEKTVYDEDCEAYKNKCFLKCAGAKRNKVQERCTGACERTCEEEVEWICGKDKTWHANECIMKCKKYKAVKENSEEVCGPKPTPEPDEEEEPCKYNGITWAC